LNLVRFLSRKDREVFDFDLGVLLKVFSICFFGV
jgi:hypothetical protein